ncbi:hypothetical protein HDU86_007574 [Geranomyces michiganensis]|nr:hypothetical protein HDU86_007574 [Geranomyces michiganensis]
MAKIAGSTWDGHHMCCGSEIKGKSTNQNVTVETSSGQEVATIKPVTTNAFADSQDSYYNANAINKKVERRALNEDWFKTPPKCIPLTSQSPIGNPYHRLLTGVDNTNIRFGVGFPAPMVDTIGVDCTVESCGMTLKFSKTFTSSLSYSVSLSESRAVTNAMGISVSQSKENSYAKSISDTIEQSWSHTSAKELHGSVSDTVSRTLTKTVELQLGTSHTKGTSQDTTTTNNRDYADANGTGGFQGWMQGKGGDQMHQNTNGKDNQQCSSQDKTWDAHPQGFGFSLGGYAQTDGTSTCDTTSSGTVDGSGSNWNHQMDGQNNWNHMGTTTTGFSLARQQGSSESDTVDSRRSDSVSDALMTSRTTENGWSNSESDTVGNSHSKMIGYTNTYSETNTKGAEMSKSMQDMQAVDRGQEQGINVQQSFEQSFDFNMKYGDCQLPVISPLVFALQVPWACKDDDNKTIIVPSDITAAAKERDRFVAGTISCSVRDYFFKIQNDGFNKRSPTQSPVDTLASGQVMVPGGNGLTSKSQEYNLKLDKNGNLALRHFNEEPPIWQTGSLNLVNNNPRLRINDKGHLVIEAQNMFNKLGYRVNDYVPVWSTVPSHLNFTVGIKGRGYSLVLQENTRDIYNAPDDDSTPDLVLYDGKGAAIWMATNAKYKNHYGYKYPEDYMMPTDVVTAPNEPYQIDPHNSIASTVKLLPTDSLGSVNEQCSNQILADTGIISPNGRFKVILQPTGNLIIKDGTRTMWQTYTADMWFARPPYKLQINRVGELYIKDGDNRRVWQSSNMYYETTSGPYVAKILDEGRFAVYGAADNMIWNMWYTSTTANTTRYGRYESPTKFCDSICGDVCRPTTITNLTSTDPMRYRLLNREILQVSASDVTTTLTIVDGTVTLTKREENNVNKPGNTLVLYTPPEPMPNAWLEIDKNLGVPVVMDSVKGRMWSPYTDFSGTPPPGPFTATVTPSGIFVVVDKAKNVRWKIRPAMVHTTDHLTSGMETDTIYSNEVLKSKKGSFKVAFSMCPAPADLKSALDLGCGVTRLTLESNGEVAAYNGIYKSWSSGSASKGVGPYTLSVREDNRLYLKDSTNKITWMYPPRPTGPITELNPFKGPDALFTGEQLISPKGLCTMQFEGGTYITIRSKDGKIYRTLFGKTTDTFITPRLVMQSDGNLVMYDEDQTYLGMSSGTYRAPAFYMDYTLTLTDSCSLYIRYHGKDIIWEYPMETKTWATIPQLGKDGGPVTPTSKYMMVKGTDIITSLKKDKDDTQLFTASYTDGGYYIRSKTNLFMCLSLGDNHSAGKIVLRECATNHPYTVWKTDPRNMDSYIRPAVDQTLCVENSGGFDTANSAVSAAKCKLRDKKFVADEQNWGLQDLIIRT